MWLLPRVSLLHPPEISEAFQIYKNWKARRVKSKIDALTCYFWNITMLSKVCSPRCMLLTLLAPMRVPQGISTVLRCEVTSHAAFPSEEIPRRRRHSRRANPKRVQWWSPAEPQMHFVPRRPVLCVCCVGPKRRPGQADKVQVGVLWSRSTHWATIEQHSAQVPQGQESSDLQQEGRRRHYVSRGERYIMHYYPLDQRTLEGPFCPDKLCLRQPGGDIELSPRPRDAWIQ